MEKVEKAVKQPSKKGNKTTEIIIGAGAAKLSSAVTTLLSVVEKVQELPYLIAQKSLEVTNLEDKIGGLIQDFENRKAQMELDLKLNYETTKQGFVNEFLSANSLTAVKSSEYHELQQKAYVTENDIDAKINAAVGKAIGIEKSNTTSALNIAALQHQNKEAANTAEIAQLKFQNSFLTQQVSDWKKALEDERAAGIKRSEAGAIHTLNVGGTTQGR